MLKTAFAAFEACEQAMVLAPSAQAWVHLWTASVHLGQAQLRQAGCMQGETLRLPADVPQLWLAVGRYAEAQGDWAQALRAYEQAQRLRPQDRLAAIWRAHVLARLGRLSEADALFESVGVHCAWPARVTRMGTAWWETLLNAPSPETLVPASAGEWCVPAPLQVGTAVLVSCDGTYWERYGAGLLESWSGQAQAAADDWTADAQNTPQVWLHVQLLNASATVVADANGRLLLIEESADPGRDGRPLPGRGLVLNQPAGHLEPDETLQQAALRETLEESGWDVRLTCFIGTYQWRTDDGRDYLRFAFGAEPVAHHPERPLDTGIVRALWLSPDELAQARPRMRSPLVWQAAQDWAARHPARENG